MENFQHSKKHTLNKKQSENKNDIIKQIDDILRNEEEGRERNYDKLLTKGGNKNMKRNINIDSSTKDIKSYKMKLGISNREKVYKVISRGVCGIYDRLC